MTKDEALIFSKSFITTSVLVASKLPVGSSARMIDGELAIARAIAVLCFSPPERWETNSFSL